MAQWNETTKKIFQLLAEGELTVDELTEELGCTRSNVTTPILKALRAGYVDRKLANKGEVVLRNPEKGQKKVARSLMVYLYHLTEKGHKRLKNIRVGPRKK